MYSLLQLSDTHIQEPDRTLKTGVVGADAFLCAIEKAKRVQPSFDAILISGDLVDSGGEAQYQELLALLEHLPSGVPVFLCLGNHDARTPFRKVFTGRLQSTGLSDLHSHFLQYTAPLFQSDGRTVRMVVMDTLEPRRDEGHLCADRIDWLGEVIQRYPHDRLLLVMHHLPFLTGSALFDAMVLQERDALLDCLHGHSNIERVLCGHFHRACVADFLGIPVVVCPSSAHAYPLQYQGGAKEPLVIDEPAGFTIHRFIHESGSAGGWTSHFVFQAAA